MTSQTILEKIFNNGILKNDSNTKVEIVSVGGNVQQLHLKLKSINPTKKLYKIIDVSTKKDYIESDDDKILKESLLKTFKKFDIKKDIKNWSLCKILLFVYEKILDEKQKKDFDINEKEIIIRKLERTLLINKIRKYNTTSENKKNIISIIENEERIMESYSNESRVEKVMLNVIKKLCWDNTCDNYIDLKKVKKELDINHYGMEAVKNAILKELASMDTTNSVICLVGAPGVGKTTICQSIAKALNRGFYQIKLGGSINDEMLKGLMPTYKASRYGEIINAMVTTGTRNPVILFDEIEKARPIIKSQLLDIFDPAQNTKFYDNFLRMEYDISSAMFICTANYIQDIPEELRNRMNIIEISKYTLEEKMQIAKKYIIPSIQNKFEFCVEFSDKAIEYMILQKTYDRVTQTQEAGVRYLKNKLLDIYKQINLDNRLGKNISKIFIKDIDDVEKYLPKEKINDIKFDPIKPSKMCGVSTAMSFIPGLGVGTYLNIYVILNKGNGKFLKLGNLEKTMLESCDIALNYIKANFKKFDIDEKIFNDNYNIVLSTSKCGIDKDGPSAGIAITTALISCFKGKKIRNDIAMTGEINLVGEVCKIGGIKEKITGSYAQGIREFIIPLDNKNDICYIDLDIRNDIKINYVSTYSQVYNIMFG